jgi:hypothetical protein
MANAGASRAGWGEALQRGRPRGHHTRAPAFGGDIFVLLKKSGRFRSLSQVRRTGARRTFRVCGNIVMTTSLSGPMAAFSRYTLTRDDERPLQFDGEELFAIESKGGPNGHRAAIYRTRGGKYVTEFSSGPVRDSRLGRPSVDSLRSIRDELMEHIGRQVAWREQKAIEYPADDRNAQSADALRNMANDLRALPLSSEPWIQLWRACALDEDVQAVEAEQEFLRSYGFGPDPRINGHDPLLNATTFVQGLAAAIEQAVYAPHRSGKAAVFDSLDDAFSWFRPGRLTNALLRQAGRWGPEFIE